MDPDLEKLRRFALASGLVLIVYSLAAVELDTGETIHPLGIPLKINRPDWLGIGLVLASVWGMGRFYYYGALKNSSPARLRRDALERWYKGERDFGSENDAMRTSEEVAGVFPKIPRTRLPIEVERVPLGGEGGGYKFRAKRGKIPFRLRIVTRFEDIDYFAPIWLNVVALGLWAFRLLKSAPWLPLQADTL